MLSSPQHAWSELLQLISDGMAGFTLDVDALRARGGGKWRNYGPEVLPAWVADMDFLVAPAVQAAIRRFSDHQDYGYGLQSDRSRLFEAFSAWMARRHGWEADPALTIASGDVVQGIVAAIVAFSDPGEGVLVQTPVYPPFLTSIANTSRRLVENRLLETASRFEVDTTGLGGAASESRVILLCNPHNPTGRVLELAELEAMASVARERDLTIVSDEIHADLVYKERTHVPMATLAPERTVTLTSATKGFNIPAVRTAVLHFGTPELKQRFEARIPEHLLGVPSRFGIEATIAAWGGGEPWLAEVLAYLDGNRRRVAEWAATTPLGHHPPEATYLAWLDCRGLRLAEGRTPFEHFLESARVALGNGADFGTPGAGNVRLNFGTSAEILEEILGRLGRVLDQPPR